MRNKRTALLTALTLLALVAAGCSESSQPAQQWTKPSASPSAAMATSPSAAPSVTSSPTSSSSPAVDAYYGCNDPAPAQPTDTYTLVMATICNPKTSVIQRQNLVAYLDYIHGKAAFENCDPGNPRSGIKFDVNKLDLTKLNPCQNGAMHFRLVKGQLAVDNALSTGKIMFITNRDSLNPISNNEMPSEGWLVVIDAPRSTPAIVVNGAITKMNTVVGIRYYAGDNVIPFMNYMSEDGGKTYVWAPNVNDYSFDTSKTYDFVFTWTDRVLDPKSLAPVPFNRNCVTNYPYAEARTC
ncbi:MAG TPA: hypothetical protein VLA77_03225 [Candidatus Saccharimonadales bacterium]|nr:hypothetical protein [Candidatus Saccharimonadales bacterium]